MIDKPTLNWILSISVSLLFAEILNLMRTPLILIIIVGCLFWAFVKSYLDKNSDPNRKPISLSDHLDESTDFMIKLIKDIIRGMFYLIILLFGFAFAAIFIIGIPLCILKFLGIL